MANGYKFLLSNVVPDAHDPITITSSSFPWKDYWKSKAPFRLLLFGWKVVNKAIPTKHVLKVHHRNVDDACVFCAEQTESVDHIFGL